MGLGSIVDFSWETVQKEKPDLVHLLVVSGAFTCPRVVSCPLTWPRTFLIMVKPVATSCSRARSRTTSTTCTSFQDLVRWLTPFSYQRPKSWRGTQHRRGPVQARDRWVSQEPRIALLEGSQRSGEIPVRTLPISLSDGLTGVKANRRSPSLCNAAVRGESSRSGSTLATETSLSTPLGVRVPCTSSTGTIPRHRQR